MTPDRSTLDFLNAIPDGDRREAELVVKDGGVTRIFGSEIFIQAQVETDKVYRARIHLQNGRWNGEVRPEDGQANVVLAAAMLERIRRGGLLPDSPNEVGEISLAAMLEEKLGRQLVAKEEFFVEKLEKRYRRFEIDGVIRDTDLVRLSPRWTVDSMDPITLWEERPRDILDFWNHIAYAFSKKNIPVPAFMEVVTDISAIADSRRDAENKAFMDAWRERIRRVSAPVEAAAVQALRLRLLVGPSDARLQWALENGEWSVAGSRSEVATIEREVHLGKWRPGAAGALLLAHFHEYLANEQTDVFDLDREPACRLLNRLFHHDGLWEMIVSLDETPFHPVPGRLAWICREDGREDGTYGLSLLAPDGSEIPHAVRALPGLEDLYLADEVVFRGPVHWGEGTEVDPHHDLPRALLENTEGIAFLDRIGTPPPPTLQRRIVDHRPCVRVEGRIVRNLTTADSEHMVAVVSAEDPDTGRVQVLRRDDWVETAEGRPVEGRIVRYDRSLLDRVRHDLDHLGFVFDSAVDGHKARVTKVFPERFHQWARALPEGVTVIGDDLVASLVADPVRATLRLEVDDKGIDWFDLRLVVDVAGVDLGQDQIRALMAARGGFLRDAEGRWLRLELEMAEDQREAIEMLGLDPYDTSGEQHRLHATQLADPSIREAFDPQAWNMICDRAASLQTSVRPDVPADLQATLRPYQVDGYHFLAYLAANRFGGVLADDMGLGKTIQSLSWILWLRSQDGKGGMPSLVVCPKSVVDVWVGEAEKFAPELRVRVLRSGTDGEDKPDAAFIQGADLVVMNYAQMRIHCEGLLDTKWLAIILDEGQQIKNPDSQAARAARRLDGMHRLVLTGTPIENRLLDLWSLMAFAMPGILGNRNYFSKRFDRRKDPQAQQRLSARLRPFLLRRTKSQVARDLPPRTEEDVFCALEGRQAELYNEELQRIQRVLLGIERAEDLARQSFVILQGLMRLRQICCHPALLDPAHAEAGSAKLNALIELLEQLHDEGHKVLVFSQFVGMLDLIKARLEEQKRPYSYLTGQTKNRREVVDHFQRTPDPEVFLLSLKAGGSGLNLTAASYVILYDPWWNPAVENQAIDRTHRIGQTQKVNAYRLLMRDTVEQKIRVLQHQKQSLFSGVLGQESFTRNLTIDDLRFLFEHDPDPLAGTRRRPERTAE